MLEIFITVLPVFLIIAAGYGAMWRGLLSNDAVDALAKFAQKFAIPCLLFLAVAQLDLKAYFNVPLFATYYLPAALIFTIGGMVGFLFFKRTPAQSVAVGFTTLFSNMVLLGLPIMERAYGTEALSTNYALASVHVLFCYIIGITCMEVLRADGHGPIAIFRAVTNAIFHNALALGLILGFAFNFSGIAMPDTLEAALEMMARSALPVALFALGGVLHRYKLNSNLPEVAAVGTIKLLLFPALVYIMGTHVFHLPVGVRNSTVIIAAMPPGINAYIFASMYNRAQQTAATSVVICTAISVFTITAWLAFLG
jgi:predicted permease